MFFYTAGIRSYGKVIMSLVKDLMLRNVDKEDQRLITIINRTCTNERLIARDDKDRFITGSERQVAMQDLVAVGGDSTLAIHKGGFKSLRALSGGNDTIFAILDDRDDVWQDEGRVPQNLLKVPGYFYHSSG